MTRPTTLTARLVFTAVGLVAVIAALIALVATAALRDSLLDQLDDDLRATAGVGRLDPDNDGDGGPPGPGPGALGRRGGPETLTAIFGSNGRQGAVLRGREDVVLLSDDVLEELADIDTDGEIHEERLPGLGTYRLIAVDRTFGTEVTGLPVAPVRHAVLELVRVEAVLIGLGALVAGAAGLVLVRRQLQPLRDVADTAHRVADLPLAQGDVDLSERVPEHLTDVRTEVGQMGAALNTLLDHVETSLDARHRSEQQVRQFVADASHELRTPLATIAGYTELARKRPEPDNLATALGKVEEESARMKSLVEDLLLLARLDSGRPLEREPVDLSRILLEAVSDARVLSPDHHWRVDLPEEPIEVVGDEQRLHQVVTNLLTNARKHTPSGTTISVTGSAAGFRVHDDGPGFPADFVDHAFERFARGDLARNRAGGAGLGLALVEAIVASHGGTVTLRSTPGDTAIDVRLP